VETLQSIEAVGASVDEAIGRALDALNVTREQVSVDIIEPGGGKLMARVRVTLVSPISAPPSPAAVAPETAGAPATPATVAPETAGAPATPDEIRMARETLTTLLEHMHIRAELEVHPAAPEDDQDLRAESGPPLIFNIKGDDLGVLIGRRGETLRDLQYLLRLIVGRQAGRNLNLVVDVEGYKARREQALRQLALRLAERAVATRKTVALEPMPASERRIVHLTLRNHPSVSTQSVGQGDDRKVTIVPKSDRP